MKKLALVLLVFGCALMVKAQVLSVPTDYITSTPAIRDSFINWTIRSQLLALSTENGTSTFTITTSWNPENSDLNAMVSAGGDTEEWPLYLTVNDSTFFTEDILGSLGGNNNNILGRYTEPIKEWGNYFKNTHEIWFYTAPNPDQYVILGALESGTIMKLSEVRAIVTGYSQCVGYRTVYTVDALKPSMIEREDW